MKRLIITTAIVTCGLLGGISQHVSAQCHKGSGHPGYGYAPGYGYDYGYGYEYGYGDCRSDYQHDPHYRYFVLLRQRPELAAQHAELAAQLNLKFGRFFNASELIRVNGQVAGGTAVVTKDAGQAVASTTVSETATVQTAATANVAPAASAVEAPAAPAVAAVDAPAVDAPTAAPAAPAVPAGEAPAAAPAAPAAGEAPVATPAAPAPPATPAAAAANTPAAADTTAPEHPEDLPGPLASAQAATASPAAAATVSDELKPILGLWRNVVKNSDGSQQVTEVELVENGNAKVTVQAGLLGKRTIEGQFAVEDGNFNLKEGNNNITLGKVVSADKDQVVLKRGDLTLNFTRP